MATFDCVLHGDCTKVLRNFPGECFSACITDPPYNYEFIGRSWDEAEIERRTKRVQKSSTLVKNIPYGSGLSGGVRNKNWYKRNRENINQYRYWCKQWGKELFRTLKTGAYALVFNSTRTISHVQAALEESGFYARDILVWRRPSGIPKGLNAAQKLRKEGDPNWESWQGWQSCLRNEWEAICLVQKPLRNNYINTVRTTGVGLLNVHANGAGFMSNIIEGIDYDAADRIDGHCTVKPLRLIRLLIQMVTPPEPPHVILDPFCGTGTTCVAAKELGFHYVGIDKSNRYCQIARDRLHRANSEPWQRFLL